MSGLPQHDARGASSALVGQVAAIQHRRAARERGERISEFVREGRDEVVFALIGEAQLGFEAFSLAKARVQGEGMVRRREQFA